MPGIARLDNETVEKKIIAYELTDSRYFRKFDTNWFVFAQTKKMQGIMNEFFNKFSSYPTPNNIRQFTTDPDVSFFLQDIASLRLSVDDGAFKLALDALFDAYVNRELFAQAKNIDVGLRSNANGRELARSIVVALSEMKNPHSFGEIQRGFAHEQLVDEWIRYKAREQDPTKFNTGIPYGIYELDRLTVGGTRPGHITLIYGDTSSGKTRFKLNLAYNMAAMGKRVMYISIEDSFDSIVRLMLSRASLLDSHEIELSKLNPDNRKAYKEMLIRLSQEKKLPYIAYWPGEGTVPMIQKEVQLYEAKTGQLPEALFIDYANEMYPTRDYNNTSERFNYLFSEIRSYAAENRMALLTSLQQSRMGKQKKKEEDFGLDDIGQSHYVAPHCHVVLFIKQTMEEKAEHVMSAYLQKNRYGKKDVKIGLTTYWEFSFVGDRNRLVQHSDDLKTLLNDPINEENDAKYQGAPINHPYSSALDDGEQIADVDVPFPDNVE